MAAENGHLELLKWAQENGCPWSKSTCISAARGGHLELLKWLRKNGCPWNEKICWVAAFIAAENGHLELSNWARLEILKMGTAEWLSF